MNHIYVRHNFICEYIEDGTVKNKYVCLEENIVDPFTKNLSNGSFQSLTQRYVNRVQISENTISLFQSNKRKVLHLIEEGC